MINIIKKRFLFFTISITALLICFVFLVTSGLNIGMDFSGGSRLTLSFEQEVTINKLEEELASLGYDTAVVQSTSGGDFIIRTEKLTSDAKDQLEADLTTAFGTLEETGFVDVSAETALVAVRIAVIAVLVAMIGIMAYIIWAFRSMPKPIRYGTCAIIALLHDTLITVGAFAILNTVMDIEVNLMFVTGILAVIGYSVNNTVVIFDRIRENLKANPSADLELVVNNSVTQTFARSINTSFTCIITVLALILFIGTNIQSFAWALLIGIIAGAFDSICVAPALLVVWEKNEWRRFISWMPMIKAKQQ